MEKLWQRLLWLCQWIMQLGLAVVISYAAWPVIYTLSLNPIRSFKMHEAFVHATAFWTAETLSWIVMALIILGEKLWKRVKIRRIPR